MVVTDKGASVLAKLKNKSKQTGKSFQVHLQLFCQEEFLRRLSMSKYVNNLVLKGGLFIYTLTEFNSRATIDVDLLLRNFPNDIEDIRSIINEILSVDTGNYYVELTAESFGTITADKKYKGISCRIMARINNTKTPFNLDIGVGDVIVPGAEKRVIPVQLKEFENPIIHTYSLESTIAEKFDAMLQRLERTSRMKDFYDVYYLSNMFVFEGRKLQLAIQKTIYNRETVHRKDSLLYIAEFGSDEKMNTKWKAFLKKTHLGELDYQIVMLQIKTFLEPIWNAIMAEKDFSRMWDNEKSEWV